MNKVITCAMIMFITSSLYSQQSNPKASYTQKHYLEKSKKQKTAGNVLLIGGAGLFVTGLLIPQGEVVSCFFVCEYENDDIKGGFILGGTISILSSIPLYIISGKTKKKAMSVSFKKENTIQLYNQNLVQSSVPAISVKVDF